MNGRDVVVDRRGGASSWPYTRREECAWPPEEVARRVSSLIPGDDGGDDDAREGLTTARAAASRRAFGANVLRDDEDDEDEEEEDDLPVRLTLGEAARHVRRRVRRRVRRSALWRRHAPLLRSLAAQLREPLLLMLVASSVVSALVGNVADAVSITLAVLLVVAVASAQEVRSERALESLRSLVTEECTVVRDGRVVGGFPTTGLVVGDVVWLDAGDRVPADCRLTEAPPGTACDESALTGENEPRRKTNERTTIASDAPDPAAQPNVVFMGTSVVAGRGKAVVLAVGRDTEFGRVHGGLAGVETRRSPLQERIDALGRALAAWSGAVIVAVGSFGLLRGRPLLDTLQIGVSLAVAAIPEGLPICVAATLALGSLRMARRNAVVRRLPAVETLGAVDVLATDKTGTLTTNRMTVRECYCHGRPDTLYRVTGTGTGNDRLERRPTSDGFGDDRRASPGDVASPRDADRGLLSALLGAASLCNHAALSDDPRTRPHAGRPTELALLAAAAAARVADPRPTWERVAETPFDSGRKRMEVTARPTANAATPCRAFRRALHQDDGTLVAIKGAPETVVASCSFYADATENAAPLGPADKEAVLRVAGDAASQGRRVLAVSYGPTSEHQILAGLVCMEDPLRPGAERAVRRLRRSGVRVIMVTGDSHDTAVSIARRCGILSEKDERDDDSSDDDDDSSDDSHDPESLLLSRGRAVLSGDDLDRVPPLSLASALSRARVLYRVAPRHKLALVRALRDDLDHVVAVAGDGVNDAAALRAADVGVAVGSGTDVARQAADVVLTDDDLETVVAAVAEGKGVFRNVRRFLAFQLSTSFAALAMQAVATLLGMPSPLNAMQILWINVIMDGPPAQSLGAEPADDRVARTPPRKRDAAVVTRPLLLRAASSAALIVLLTLRVFALELDDGKITRRDTTMTFATFVNCDLLNAYACRSSDKCVHELSLASNPAFVWAVAGSALGQFAVVYAPPLQEIFQTEALSFSDVLYVLVLSSTILWLDTLRKRYYRRWCVDDDENDDENDVAGYRRRRRRRRRRGRRASSGSPSSSSSSPTDSVGESSLSSSAALSLSSRPRTGVRSRGRPSSALREEGRVALL